MTMKKLISSILIILCLASLIGCSVQTDDETVNVLVEFPEFPSVWELIIIFVIIHWLYKKDEVND